MYLNLTPLLLASRNAFFSCSILISDGLVESMQASILTFALEVNCNTVFITFSSPCSTSVLTSTILRADPGLLMSHNYKILTEET
jgi:hypothetical protein